MTTIWVLNAATRQMLGHNWDVDLARHLETPKFEKAWHVLLGLVGFEPTASASRSQRSTKLSHSPILDNRWPAVRIASRRGSFAIMR